MSADFSLSPTHCKFHSSFVSELVTRLSTSEQLENRKAENEAVCVAHREKIQQLWERLQIPQEERENMSVHMSLSKKRNMDAVSQS